VLPVWDEVSGALRRLGWKAANQLSGDYRTFQLELQRWAALDPAAAAADADARLHRYLNYCRTYSSYWRERWPADVRTFAPDEASEVLALLPPLTKEDLRAHLEEIRILPEHRHRADGYPPLRRPRRQASGGSTGQPVFVYVDDGYTARLRATADFFYTFCGLRPGEPFFYLWGRETELREIRSTWRKVVAAALRGNVPMPVFSLDDAKLAEIRETIARRTDVRAAVCFTSALETLVDSAERSGHAMRTLERVFCGGALLSPWLRQRILGGFAREVFDTYGSRDIGLMAHETPGHDGLAVAVPVAHIEVLNADGRYVGEGGHGMIHVSAVSNFACALLRVDMGDTARWHAAPGNSGLPGPRLTDLGGRVTERIVGPGGVVVDPSAVIHIIGVVIAPGWLRRFQLHQISPTEYELHVEAWPGEGGSDREQELERVFGREMEALMRSPLQVRVRRVEAIPLLASGKHRYIVTPQPAAAAR
jgi:phenylacetate-CoA ligase